MTRDPFRRKTAIFSRTSNGNSALQFPDKADSQGFSVVEIVHGRQTFRFGTG